MVKTKHRALRHDVKKYMVTLGINVKISLHKLVLSVLKLGRWSPGFTYFFWNQYTSCINVLCLVFVVEILFGLRKLQTHALLWQIRTQVEHFTHLEWFRLKHGLELVVCVQPEEGVHHAHHAVGLVVGEAALLGQKFGRGRLPGARRTRQPHYLPRLIRPRSDVGTAAKLLHSAWFIRNKVIFELVLFYLLCSEIQLCSLTCSLNFVANFIVHDELMILDTRSSVQTQCTLILMVHGSSWASVPWWAHSI